MKRILFAIAALLVSASGICAQSSNSVNFNGVTPPAAPVITPPTVPGSGYVGAAVTITINGTGFANTCTASLNGSTLPTTFVSATQMTMAVPAGKVVAGNNPIVVTCPLPVLSLTVPNPKLPNGVVGQAYSTSLAAAAQPTGGVPPYSYSSSSLPTGLSLSASGVVSGVPSVAGSSTFGFTVTDSVGTALVVKFGKGEKS